MTLMGGLTPLLVLSGFKRIKDAPAYKIHARRQGRAMLPPAVDSTAPRPRPDV